MNTRSAVTLRDVADAVGVSRQVVATVLTGKGSARASSDTRDRIVKAAAEMGYRPHGAARTLATGKTRTIELQAHSVGDQLYRMPRHHLPVWGAVAEVCQERDYRLLLVSRQNETSEAPLRNLFERNVDALILLGATVLRVLETAHDNGIPSMCINPEMARELLVEAGYEVVDFDNSAGVRMALEHLVQLGHRHIGFVRGRATNQDFEERWRAYWRFMIEHGLPVQMEWVWENIPGYVNGLQVGRQVLAARHRPTAILAACDALALGVMHVLLEAGLNIPNDLSIIGFDDTESAPIIYPGLTTVRLDWVGLGRLGADRLFDRLAHPQGPASPSLHRYPVELILRQSCAPLR